MTTPWDHRKWGTLNDPIHKSDLNQIVGEYGCLKSFQYSKQAVAAGRSRDNEMANGRMAAGTATHETIARALSNKEVCAKLLAGTAKVTVETTRGVFLEEMRAACNGKQAAWYDADPDKVCHERVQMVVGLLNNLHKTVAEIVLIEPCFIVNIGGYWCSGHVDIIYRPREDPTKLALGDWKSGASKPAQIELDHSYESGIYSAAMLDGGWIRREDVVVGASETEDRYTLERRALEAAAVDAVKNPEGEFAQKMVRLAEFPEQIRYVHLKDFVPYQKAGDKTPERPEELEHYAGKLDASGKVKYVKGDLRGPGWYRVRRTEHDVPRLRHLLKNVVGTVRMGRFFESVGEKCDRCAWKKPCLTDGYSVTGDDAKQLEQQLKGIDLPDDGLGEVA